MVFFCEVHEVRVTYKCNTRQVIGNLNSCYVIEH